MTPIQDRIFQPVNIIIPNLQPSAIILYVGGMNNWLQAKHLNCLESNFWQISEVFNNIHCCNNTNSRKKWTLYEQNQQDVFWYFQQEILYLCDKQLLIYIHKYSWECIHHIKKKLIRISLFITKNWQIKGDTCYRLPICTMQSHVHY